MKRWIVGAGLIVVGLAVLYWQNMDETDVPPKPSASTQALTQAIVQCDLVATKAAAELPEALPFQRLEKAARQSRVLERCMHDHGYQEAVAWSDRMAATIDALAKQKQISVNEAYETLRRAAMLATPVEGQPGYWAGRPLTQPQTRPD